MLTVEEEENYTNFLIVVDYTNSLFQTWIANATHSRAQAQAPQYSEPNWYGSRKLWLLTSVRNRCTKPTPPTDSGFFYGRSARLRCSNSLMSAVMSSQSPSLNC